MTRTWPEDWESRKRGDSCFFCADLSDRSFYRGRASEALLERWAIATGHAAVVFRGRHVADLGDLTPEELTQYWRDVQHVGRAVIWAPSQVPQEVFDRQFTQLRDLSRDAKK